MSQYYNLKQYSEAGEPWSMPGRGEFQTFFIDLDGVEGTVLTNKKKGNTPKLGQIYGDLVHEGKLNKRGEKIYKFKQAQVPEGEQALPKADAWAGTATGAQANQSPSSMPEWFAPYAVMIKDLHSAMANTDLGVAVVDKREKQEEPFESPVEEKKENKLSQAELEDIFGGKMEPIEIED